MPVLLAFCLLTGNIQLTDTDIYRIGTNSAEYLEVLEQCRNAVSTEGDIPRFEIMVLDLTEAKRAIRTGRLDAYAQVDQRGIQISYSLAISQSTNAASILSDVLRAAAGSVEAPVSLTEVSGVEQEHLAAFMMAPGGLLMAAATACGTLAVAATVRERETDTLESLISTGVGAWELIAGKAAAVVVGTQIATIAGVLGTWIFGTAFISSIFTGWGPAFVYTLETCSQMGLLLSGAYLVVGMASKTVREAQTYIGFTSTLIVLPSIFLSTTPVGAGIRIWAIPVLGQSALIRDALYEAASLDGLGISTTVSVALFLACCIATRFTMLDLRPLRRL